MRSVRFFAMWLVMAVGVVGLTGCGPAGGTQVLDSEAPRDPSLGDDYYDAAAYDAIANGDPNGK